MLLKIVLKNIIYNKYSSILCVLLMALGIGLISSISLIYKNLEDKFTKNITGIDMVVGAKGSPLQLILSGIFQADSPTGNIEYQDYLDLKSNTAIKKIIPLSMGDNLKGFRIIGTNDDYLNHFKAELAKGKIFNKPLEVVLGAQAQKKLNLGIGQTFFSNHGLDKDGESHAENKYKVVGILKPNNSVIDQLIISDLESVWQVHDHGTTEITCALVKFKSPLGLMTIPRNINQNTKMQAALPSIEINRLLQIIGTGADFVKYLSYLIMFISGLSIFMALFNALKERKYEITLMLTLGASMTKLFVMLLLEGIILVFTGYVLGLVISRIGIFILKNNLATNLEISLGGIQKDEIILGVISLLIGIFAAIIPAMGIYKINIAKTLATK